MLQLKNNTPFNADMVIFPNEEGIDTLYILIKGTFKIGKHWTLADKQPGLNKADLFWGEPESSSVKFSSDYHPSKMNTDIIMVGSAFAPNSQPVSQLDVNLRVGECNKRIRVFGDRQWNGGKITKAIPFQSMPMVYERAYGGQHQNGETIYSEPANPVGLGFVGKRDKTTLNGLPLPNLEDPKHLISSLSDTPKPACFGAVAGHWQPRVSFAGTYGDHWQTTRAPYLPTDFDKRFFNSAHNDLTYSGFLTGGEEVDITNMHSKGRLKFSLPFVKINANVLMAGTDNTPTLNLETLLLEPNNLSLSMVWKGSLMCDKKVQKIKQVTLTLAR